MTGWRIAYAAGAPEIIDAMMKIHQFTMLCAPIMAQLAALEAISNGYQDSEDMIEQYAQRRRVIVTAPQRGRAAVPDAGRGVLCVPLGEGDGLELRGVLRAASLRGECRGCAGQCVW